MSQKYRYHRGALQLYREMIYWQLDLYAGKNIIAISNVRKVGVIELSTRAVKLLVGNSYMLKKQGFDFDYFYRNGMLTHTGNAVLADGSINADVFKARVLPVLNIQISNAKKSMVTELYVVATAVYRNAPNLKDIIDIIYKETGMLVKVLNQEEEALATLTAIVYSNNGLKHMKKDLLMIDQGGGSTEIIYWNRKQNQMAFHSIDMGTLDIRNNIMQNYADKKSIKSVIFEENTRLRKELHHKLKIGDYNSDRNIHCVGLGTAITRSTQKRGNKSQHGEVLTRKTVFENMMDTHHYLAEHYHQLGELKEQLIKEQNVRQGTNIEDLIVMRFGLSMFLEIMKNYNVYNLTVSGAGVWYGIYYQAWLFN